MVAGINGVTQVVKSGLTSLTLIALPTGLSLIKTSRLPLARSHICNKLLPQAIVVGARSHGIFVRQSRSGD